MKVARKLTGGAGVIPWMMAAILVWTQIFVHGTPAGAAPAAVTLDWVKTAAAGATGDGQFNSDNEYGPQGIALDPESGYLFVTDIGNDRIQMFDSDGQYAGQFGTFGSGPSEFNTLMALAFDEEGYLYVTDRRYVRKFDVTYNGSGNWTIDPVVQWGGSAGLSYPQGILVYGNDLYVADTNNNRVLRFDASDFNSSSPIDVVASTITGAYGLAADSTGVYVSSRTGGYIVKLDAEGHELFRSESMSRPAGLFLSSDGYLYAAYDPTDMSGLLVRLDDRLRKSALLLDYDGMWDPGNVILDDNGNLYITDLGNKTLKKYTIGSPDNHLSSLAVSEGALSPSPFDEATAAYTVNVGNEVESINITPTAVATATISIGGNPADNGEPFNVGLSAGDNPVSIVVTAANGAARTYTVAVTRAKSSNASLSRLTLLGGKLNETFDQDTTEYTADVANGVTAIAVTPTAADAAATVNVNGEWVPRGGTSNRIDLTVGDNVTEVIVTAGDGTTKTYTLTVTRAPSAEASLSNLTVSPGGLNETFDQDTTEYTVDVANDVTAITVTPTVADAAAMVKVKGSTVTRGNASDPIDLTVGANAIDVVVTAEDGTTKTTYTLTVTRAPSAEASLSNLTVNAGALNETFDPSTTEYTVDVANDVTAITVTPTVADAAAMVKVKGSTVTRGSASDPIDLTAGANVIDVVVTAEDGTTKTTYTLTVTRAPSVEASLSNLTVSPGALNESFDPGTTEYTVDVANDVTAIAVTPTVADGTATVKVRGATVTSGSASDPIGLSVGDNIITVEVTAQDGSTRAVYTIVVTRAFATSYQPQPVSEPESRIQSDPEGGVTLTVDPSDIRQETRPDGTVAETVNLDEKILNEALEALKNAEKPTLSIKVNDKGQAVQVPLPASWLALAAKTVPNAIVEVKLNGSSFQLVLSVLNLDEVAARLGVERKDIKVNVSMERVGGETKDKLDRVAAVYGVRTVGNAIDYKLTVMTANGKSEDIREFGGTYMARAIVLDANAPGNGLTAVFYDPAAGTLSFIPSGLTDRKDGKREMVMNAPHNSIYAVVESGSRSFADLNGHWAKADIELLASNLIVQGESDIRFAPDVDITRAEFAALLVRSLGLSLNANPSVSSFSDVPADAWYAPAVEAAVNGGLAEGTSTQGFSPNLRITREQMAVMIANALEVVGRKPDSDGSKLSGFVDGNSVSDWAREAVDQAAVAGIVTGMPDGSFAPTQYATRAQAAVMLKRLLEYVEFLARQ